MWDALAFFPQFLNTDMGLKYNRVLSVRVVDKDDDGSCDVVNAFAAIAPKSRKLRIEIGLFILALLRCNARKESVYGSFVHRLYFYSALCRLRSEENGFFILLRTSVELQSRRACIASACWADFSPLALSRVGDFY